MPDEYIDSVITSPPYWQLRDYGYDGQWGLEPTFEKYLEHLWEMMNEIYRVLKPTGTCWINLGDTYGGGNSGKGGDAGKHKIEKPNIKGTRFENGIKKPLNKCLLLIPHRFAIGCIDRGWIMRNDIIWEKRNGMPESCTDRLSKKHEYFFFMVKSEKYYFDLDSIRDKHKGDYINNKTITSNSKSKYDSIENESAYRQGMNKERGSNIVIKRNNLPSQKMFVDFIRNRTTINMVVDSTDIIKSKVEHWFRYDVSGFSFPSIEDWNTMKHLCDNYDDEFHNIDVMMNDYDIETDDINKNIEKGKNPSDVSEFWDIPTKPSKEKHYASYNDALITKPVLAGCPEGGIIYDPFMGTGSTAEVALRSNRNYIGSEMSEEYCKIADRRLQPFKMQCKLF